MGPATLWMADIPPACQPHFEAILPACFGKVSGVLTVCVDDPRLWFVLTIRVSADLLKPEAETAFQLLGKTWSALFLSFFISLTLPILVVNGPIIVGPSSGLVTSAGSCGGPFPAADLGLVLEMLLGVGFGLGDERVQFRDERSRFRHHLAGALEGLDRQVITAQCR